MEFKRLALSDPNSGDHDFVKHSKDCPDCLKYVSGVRKMDLDLSNSLDIDLPSDLIARLQLNQEMAEDFDDNEENLVETAGADKVVAFQPMRRYAVAACLAVSLFVAGFMVSGQFATNQIGSEYEILLSGLVEHMDEQAVTPIWDADRANTTANALLASYDGEMQIKYLENLQFARICPLGNHKGLHSSLMTENGQVSFAYVKGEPVREPLDASYEGYVSKVKPVRGGNLIIVSRSNKGVQQADTQLKEAIYWDI